MTWDKVYVPVTVPTLHVQLPRLAYVLDVQHTTPQTVNSRLFCWLTWLKAGVVCVNTTECSHSFKLSFVWGWSFRSWDGSSRWMVGVSVRRWSRAACKQNRECHIQIVEDLKYYCRNVVNTLDLVKVDDLCTNDVINSIHTVKWVHTQYM